MSAICYCDVAYFMSITHAIRYEASTVSEAMGGGAVASKPTCNYQNTGILVYIAMYIHVRTFTSLSKSSKI